VYGAFVLAVLGTSFVLLRKDLFPTPLLPLAGNVIDIAADMGGFSVSEIYVQSGVPVTIRLTSLDNSHHSDGAGKHQWAVDELGINIIAPSLGSSYATFTPRTPGRYTFYCDICCGGRANPSMNGTLIVEGGA
jgi:heme/copper-type cytochrome/quinol oxidase subunit 2